MPLYVQNGNLLNKTGTLGTSVGCCCICPLGECEITIEFLDENRCEDDVFDLYLKNPTTEVERFIQEVDLASTPAGECGEPSAEYANIIIPVTVTETDFDEECKVIIGVRFVSSNCCGTWARFRIRRPNGCLLYGEYFFAGLETTYTWNQLCNDDPCPPPPPEPCCSRRTECEGGTLINWCGSDSGQQCCSTYADGNDAATEECSGENPPVTSCEENGNAPPESPPYDCINGAFQSGQFEDGAWQSGAWVTVSGWSSYLGDTSGLTADEIALIDEIDALVNSTFFVPLICLGTAETTIDLGVGEERDTEDCSGSQWFATVSVNLCARTASVNVFNVSCFDGTEISINLSDLTAITVPCNSWTGCNCAGYQDDIPVIDDSYGGGTLEVSESP